MFSRSHRQIVHTLPYNGQMTVKPGVYSLAPGATSWPHLEKWFAEKALSHPVILISSHWSVAIVLPWLLYLVLVFWKTPVQE